MQAYRMTSLLRNWIPTPSYTLARCMATQAEFEAAKDRLGKLTEDPGNETKLKMYALFKQATVGPVNTKRPGMTDFVGRYKWDAWKGLGEMTQEEARAAYVGVVEELEAKEGVAAAPPGASEQKYTCLLSEVKDGLRTITLNRPAKKNAITTPMYAEWQAALEEAAADPNTVVTAITGAGDFYCSGNDLSNFTNIPEGGPEQLARDSAVILENFVNAFIEHPKPLVAVVQGPAVGISVTVLGLFDAVYASDAAWFQTPFTSLGQSAEGCSSYTFPRIMGPGVATEMLLFNKKMSAAEAARCGLVTEVFPAAKLGQEVWPKLAGLAKLPPLSLVYGKRLVRDVDREALKQANKAECSRLIERWLSDECRDAVMAFLSRRK